MKTHTITLINKSWNITTSLDKDTLANTLLDNIDNLKDIANQDEDPRIFVSNKRQLLPHFAALPTLVELNEKAELLDGSPEAEAYIADAQELNAYLELS
jgi:hypothetical protein